jgi:uncharacterized protein YggE
LKKVNINYLYWFSFSKHGLKKNEFDTNDLSKLPGRDAESEVGIMKGYQVSNRVAFLICFVEDE